MLRFRVLFGVFSLSLLCGALPGQSAGSPSNVSSETRSHFPDLTTASAKALEEQGDLLRVRHEAREAMTFYRAALSRFGETGTLLNKIGMTHVELRNVVLAESYFRRAVKLDRNNWEGWNNLAAIAYVQRQYDQAVSGYKRSLKINRASAVSHVNLSTVYFEKKEYDKALREMAEALRMDANVLTRDVGLRVAPRVLPAADRARTFLEIAKLFAQRGLQTEMLRELAQAQENGMDVLTAMSKDRLLLQYLGDPRITSSIQAVKPLGGGDANNLASVSNIDPHTAPPDTAK